MFEGKIKRTSHRLIAFMTGLVMLVTTMSLSVIPAMAAENTWNLSDTVTATLNDGVFTVSGSGDMPTTYSATNRPYQSEINNITSVVINSGITSIGKMCFANCLNLTSVVIADTVTSIGASAFANCKQADLVIDIKGTLTKVETNAFGQVVGTIIVYNQSTYDLVYAKATKATVKLNADTSELKDALRKQIDEIKAEYPEWFYTEESYKGLKDKIDKAEAALAKDPASADELTEAQSALKSNPGLGLVSIIQDALNAANDINTKAYTPSSVKVLNDAIAAAEALKNDTEKDQDKVEAAVAALEAASTIDETGVAETGLKKKASMDKAVAFSGHHNSAIKTNSGYTEESWAEYQKVLDEYEKVYQAATADLNNIDATDQQIDAAMQALDEAAKKLEKIPLKLDEYNAAKKAVEDILNAKDSPYTTGSLASVKAVYDFNTYEVDENGEIPDKYTQDLIDRFTENLKNVIDPKSESYRLVLKGDVTNLADLVEGCQDLIESDYTSDSWKIFTTAKEAAEALVNDPDSAGADAIKAAEEALQKAIDTIVINYSNGNGDEVPAIGYIKKGGIPLVIDDGTADDTLAGAASVRVVFDCAADVNFNPWAAIEIKALVNGVESYKKFEGTDNTETNGTKDWIVELALTNPIASGNSYELSGFTYAWNGAADYVYAITKVEYLDADGKVLKTVSGANDNAKLDDFNEKVDDAKARIESGRYTEDSIKALEEAVAKADALLKESNGRPLPSKMSVIEEEIAKAIEGLVEMPKGNISGTVVTPNANAEVTVTVETSDGTEVAKAMAANGEYTVSDLEDGEYVITFAAEGYVTRSYKATVAGGDITLEAEIHIVGDINGDGNITTVDVGLANAHVKQTKTLEEYDFEVAEVSGDDMITTVDVGKINSTAKGA